MGRRTIGKLALSLGLLHLAGGQALAREIVRDGLREDSSVQAPLKDWGGPRGDPQMQGATNRGLSQMTGQVLRVDPESRMIVMRMGPVGPMIRFWVPPEALISQGRYPLEVRDLEVGDWARVDYGAKGGERIAREVQLQ